MSHRTGKFQGLFQGFVRFEKIRRPRFFLLTVVASFAYGADLDGAGRPALQIIKFINRKFVPMFTQPKQIRCMKDRRQAAALLRALKPVNGDMRMERRPEDMPARFGEVFP